MVASLSYWDLQKKIKSEDIGALYLFTGEEEFLKRGALESIKKLLVPGNLAQFNYNFFYAEDTSFETIAECLTTQPMLAKRRLVVLKNAEECASFKEKFIPALKKMPSKTCLILDTRENLKNKFVLSMSGLCVTINFSRLRGAMLRRWVEGYCLDNGRKITPAAVGMILEKIQDNLDLLSKALDNLCLYKNKSTVITEREVELLVGKMKRDDKFAFLDALAARKTAAALSMADALSRQGRDSADIIGLINWQFKRLELMKPLLRQNVTAERIAKKLNLNNYNFEIVARQAAKITSRELQRNLRLLLECDVAIKQGTREPRLALEMLIVRLCSGK